MYSSGNWKINLETTIRISSLSLLLHRIPTLEKLFRIYSKAPTSFKATMLFCWRALKNLTIVKTLLYLQLCIIVWYLNQHKQENNIKRSGIGLWYKMTKLETICGERHRLRNSILSLLDAFIHDRFLSDLAVRLAA